MPSLECCCFVPRGSAHYSTEFMLMVLTRKFFCNPICILVMLLFSHLFQERMCFVLGAYQHLHVR